MMRMSRSLNGQRLLDQSLQQLARLAQLAPVFVSAEAEDEPLFRTVEERIENQWRFEVPEVVRTAEVILRWDVPPLRSPRSF